MHQQVAGQVYIPQPNRPAGQLAAVAPTVPAPAAPGDLVATIKRALPWLLVAGLAIALLVVLVLKSGKRARRPAWPPLQARPRSR